MDNESDSECFVYRVLREGERNRACANHLLNAASSRSHALLSITVRRKVGGDSSIDRQTTPNAKNNQNNQNKPDNRVRVLKGKLLLVDLAGCERVGKSGAEGTTLDEAIAINLHLHALGKCIAALALNGADSNSTNIEKTNDGSSNISPTHVHVPYRESKLTRLLKDSLGGTAMTSLIVTVAPGAGTFLTPFPYY
jgi:kinesin family protein 5